MEIFDRDLLKINKDKGYRSFYDSTFLHEAALDGIALRLYIKPSYERALVLGLRNVKEASEITENPAIKEIIYADYNLNFLNEFRGSQVLMDEENLSFADHSFDLIISVLNIHTINDVPGFFTRVKKMLKPGGLFVGSLFGSKTLYELKESFIETEIKLNLPVSPHIYPLTDIKEIAALAMRCGFIEPVSDTEIITVHYNDLARLFTDIKNIGETNILKSRNRAILPYNFFSELKSVYQSRFGLNSGDEKLYPASFEIIHIAGFAN